MRFSAPLEMPGRFCPTSMTYLPLVGKGEGWDVGLLNTYYVLGPEDGQTKIERHGKASGQSDSKHHRQPFCAHSEAFNKCSLQLFRDSLFQAYLFQLDGGFI